MHMTAISGSAGRYKTTLLYELMKRIEFGEFGPGSVKFLVFHEDMSLTDFSVSYMDLIGDIVPVLFELENTLVYSEIIEKIKETNPGAVIIDGEILVEPEVMETGEREPRVRSTRMDKIRKVCEELGVQHLAYTQNIYFPPPQSTSRNSYETLEESATAGPRILDPFK